MPHSRHKIHLYKDYRYIAREYYRGAVFVAFDTETTGLHAESDFLMEIGAVKFNCGGTIGEPFDQLIQPPVSIPPFLTELTHITNSMVHGMPTAASVVPEFLKFVGDSRVILLAHNAPFDVGFINVELERALIDPLPNRVIDTLPLSRWAYPNCAEEGESGVYKLQSLAKRLSIPVHAAHRANDDARVCMDLFTRIVQDTIERQKSWKQHATAVSYPIQPELF